MAAYSAALLEFTRDRVPLDWATTQMSLGHAQLLIATRRNDLTGLSAIEARVAEARSVAFNGGDEPGGGLCGFRPSPNQGGESQYRSLTVRS